MDFCYIQSFPHLHRIKLHLEWRKQRGASDFRVGTAREYERPEAEPRFAPLSHEMGEGPGERAGASSTRCTSLLRSPALSPPPATRSNYGSAGLIPVMHRPTRKSEAPKKDRTRAARRLGTSESARDNRSKQSEKQGE